MRTPGYIHAGHWSKKICVNMLEKCVAMDCGCRENGWEKGEDTFYVLQVVKSNYKNV